MRDSYNGNSAVASAVSGVLDAFSAGILLYTGLVEVSPVFSLTKNLTLLQSLMLPFPQLLGHEILLNPGMMKASNGKLAYVFICMLLGSGLMALLGRWA